MPDIKTGTIQITGLADLEKRLRELPDKLARNVMRGAVRAGAVVIQKEAKQKVPVAAGPYLHGRKGIKTWYQPGTLKKGIKVRSAPRGKAKGIEYWIYVSRNLYWWRFLEFGTSKMKAANGGSGFMRPAFEAQKEAATVHAITDPADSPADADALREDLVASVIPSVESALNALGTKINNVLAVLEAHKLNASS